MDQKQLYFNQPCQICGRGMRVRIDLLGTSISCGHCHVSCIARPVESHSTMNLAGQDVSQSLSRTPMDFANSKV